MKALAPSKEERFEKSLPPDRHDFILLPAKTNKR